MTFQTSWLPGAQESFDSCPILNLFIYLFWLCWVFLAAGGLSLVVASGGYSSLRCVGFSLRWLLLLRSTGSSSCGSRAVEHRLSSCGARAQLLRGMWDLPRPGLEPVSPALAGGLSTTAPPGKPYVQFYISSCLQGNLSKTYCIPHGFKKWAANFTIWLELFG